MLGRLAETLVDGFANAPQGSAVGLVDPPADPEVLGVADDGFGAEGVVELEVLFDPRGSVVAADFRLDAFGEDLGAGRCPGCGGDPSSEDDRDQRRPAHVEMVADEPLEEGPAGGWGDQRPGCRRSRTGGRPARKRTRPAGRPG